MSQGAAASSDPCPLTMTLTPAAASDVNAATLLPQTSAASDLTLSDLGSLSKEELIVYAQQLQTQNTVLDLKLRQIDSRSQQHSTNDPTKNHQPLENENEPQPPPPKMVRPGVRIHVPDMVGMRVEHPSDEARHRELVDSEQEGGSGEGPGFEYSAERAVCVASMPDDQKCEVLFQALGKSQTEAKEAKTLLRKSNEENHVLIGQLNVYRMKCEQLESDNARMKDEAVTMNDELKALKRQVQRLTTPELSNLASLRPGIKRGRFLMSKTVSLECCNCQALFASPNEACNSVCHCHPRPPCALPNKMVAEVFPAEELSRHRYWPCCQAIGTKTPKPCYSGQHDLKVL